MTTYWVRYEKANIIACMPVGIDADSRNNALTTFRSKYPTAKWLSIRTDMRDPWELDYSAAPRL